jgi:hypothetical protein
MVQEITCTRYRWVLRGYSAVCKFEYPVRTSLSRTRAPLAFRTPDLPRERSRRMIVALLAGYLPIFRILAKWFLGVSNP